MSSPMKDARWQLANDMLQHTTYADNLVLLPYPLQEHIMASAQSVLETLTPPEVAELAKLSNEEKPETVRLGRGYVNMARLEELQRFNRQGESKMYIIDQAELDEILELAMDGIDAQDGIESMSGKKILKALAGLIKEEL